MGDTVHLYSRDRQFRESVPLADVTRVSNTYIIVYKGVHYAHSFTRPDGTWEYIEQP